MKNNTLIRNIAVLLVVALVCVMTGQIYLKQLKNDTFYTANPNITKVLHLSDYNPNLKGTANDVEVYVFDSGVPGGKALIYGGTHTNEVGSMLSADLSGKRKVRGGHPVHHGTRQQQRLQPHPAPAGSGQQDDL